MMTARWRRGALALGVAGVALLTAGELGAQAIVVRDLGPGRPGRIVRSALAARHSTVVADTPAVLPRDTSYGETVLILAPSASVASSVRGDVVVVGGDLFLHPGAVIDGHAIAIGGGVYNSTLAVVRGGRQEFRDHGFAAERSGDTVRLAYRRVRGRAPETFFLPGIYGLRLPSYDRVNGATLPVGPQLSLDTARVVLDPLLTYRSHLGAVDPSLALTIGLGRRVTLALAGGRTTVSNEAWIRPDAINSFTTLVSGLDTRNHYRADRAEGRVARLWETESAEWEPFVGALTEQAWSTGSRGLPEHAAWSLLSRRDTLGISRPNPEVARGRTSAAVAGGRLRYEQADLLGNLVLTSELPFASPGDERYVQTTLDGDVVFDALGDHRLQFFLHAVLTAGDPAPPQRHAYLGGSGTVPTRPLLSLGGDQLLFVESRYVVPLRGVTLPFVGSPLVTLRHLAGSAGVTKLPPLVHNVGVRVTVSAVRFDFVIDPDNRDTDWGVSLAFFR